MERLLEALKNLEAGAKALDEMGFGYQAESVREAILAVVHGSKSLIDQAAGVID